MLMVDLSAGWRVPDFWDNEREDAGKKSKIVLGFEFSMTGLTKVFWWSLYPSWKSGICNTTSDN